MENLVRMALRHHNRFRSELRLDRKWEQGLHDVVKFELIHAASMRDGMFQNWILVLTSDERFAIEKHLSKVLMLQRVAYMYRKHRNSPFLRGDRQPGYYQASALKTILSYCKTYEEIIGWRFCDLNAEGVAEIMGADWETNSLTLHRLLHLRKADQTPQRRREYYAHVH